MTSYIYLKEINIVNYIDKLLQEDIVQRFIKKELSPKEFKEYLNEVDLEIRTVINKLTIKFLNNE